MHNTVILDTNVIIYILKKGIEIPIITIPTVLDQLKKWYTLENLKSNIKLVSAVAEGTDCDAIILASAKYYNYIVYTYDRAMVKEGLKQGISICTPSIKKLYKLVL